jgi:hypothetical protein
MPEMCEGNPFFLLAGIRKVSASSDSSKKTGDGQWAMGDRRKRQAMGDGQ